MGVEEDKLLIQYPFRVIRCGPKIYLRHTQKFQLPWWLGGDRLCRDIINAGSAYIKYRLKWGGGGGGGGSQKRGIQADFEKKKIFKTTHEI